VLLVITQIQPVWVVTQIINLFIHAISVLVDTIHIKIYQNKKLFVKHVQLALLVVRFVVVNINAYSAKPNTGI
jgi:hypothetical protein